MRDMECKAEHSRGRQNSRYSLDCCHTVLGPCLDSHQCLSRNDTIQQASFNHDWVTGYRNSCYPNNFHPSGNMASYILPRTPQLPEFYVGERYVMNDPSAQSSSLCDNDSFLTHRPAHEPLPYSILRSFYNTSYTQSCSSNESPISPEASQTYPLEIQYYQSSTDAYGQVGSCYSGTAQENEKFMLQEIKTALPVSDSYKFIDVIQGEARLVENSDWNSDMMQEGHENCSQSSLSVLPQRELGEVSSDADDANRLESMSEVDQGVVCLPTTCVSEGQLQGIELDTAPGDVRKLLLECAEAISDGDTERTHNLIKRLRKVVSILGEPMERLGAYMLEGLVARLQSSGQNIYNYLKCKEPTSKELRSYMSVLYQVCPYFKFGYTAANGAIAEAFKGEQKVHIIDFQIAMGSQWVTLIQALSKRPNGPPHVRITGIDDPMAEFARGGGLDIVGTRLSKIAKSCNVPFEFHAVPVMGSDVEANMIECRPGEALAVNFPFQLHHMPDESVSLYNHRDRILQMVKGFSPKVVTLVEQEANTNTSAFFPRFKETLSYYTAMFESLDVKLPRDSVERINVEQQCLARDIVNVIACEGADRVERHELLSKWKIRFMMVGFKPYPLSKCVNSTIKELLQDYSQQYRYFEKEDALYLGWLDRDLVTASAWH
eukprot:TRINITY_DN13493_c0_g2_i3.p1 TRINITY_DN13493_c0_g2~~TRINITY_DN13493_c0_g2_i3.p1  ORF type:complete len:660 (-),score=101.68 TRINITY_DN13493_c0_g2_i3:398-2377(-)